MPPADNDNDDFVAVPSELSVAAQSALWHVRTYSDLLRPRLRSLATEPGHARALATQLSECIGCRRSIRCEDCPVARRTTRV